MRPVGQPDPRVAARPLKRGFAQLATPEAARMLLRRPGWLAAQLAQGPAWWLDRRRTLDLVAVPDLLEHAAAVGARPLLVAKPGRGAIGLARKP